MLGGDGVQRHLPVAFPEGKRHDAHCTWGWLGSSPFWMGAEKFAPTGIRSQDRPARSEQLYGLCSPGPSKEIYTQLKQRKHGIEGKNLAGKSKRHIRNKRADGTTQSRSVHLKKLIVVRVVTRFTAFSVIRTFITVSKKKYHHWTLFWATKTISRHYYDTFHYYPLISAPYWPRL